MTGMNDLRACRERALKNGVPEHVADWWLKLARPRVVLDQVGDESEAGRVPASGYYGGSPFLSEDVSWSGLPHFVASVDCATLPAVSDLPLPDEGQLLFFGNKGEIDFRPTAWDIGGRVLYVPVGTATSERLVPDDALEEFEREPFPIHRRLPLRQSFHWSFPNWESVDDASIGDVYEIYEQFELNDLSFDLSSTGTFELGGYPAIVHSDPCAWVREVCGYDDWRLLAETRNYFTYSFAGYMYWVIREQDLVERRFDRVKTLMQGAA